MDLLQWIMLRDIITYEMQGLWHIEKHNLKKLILVWHLHNFLLPYITTEEIFIISPAIIFKLHNVCFAVE